MSESKAKRARNDPEVRRGMILEEAIRFIGTRGYNGFAVQDLAKRCGLTTGGLLYHFHTKEALLIEVLRECDRRWEAVLITSSAGQQLDGDPGSLAAVLALFRNMMAIGVAEPELVRLLSALSGEALDKEHPGYAYLREREARTLDGYAQMVAAHSPEPRSTARQIHALSLGLEQQWLRADMAFDLLAEWDRAIVKLLPAKTRARRK
jgi:AcrR family transcriptional regulator